MFDATKNIATSLTAKQAVIKAVSPNDRSVELSFNNILPLDIILGIFIIISILGIIILG